MPVDHPPSVPSNASTQSTSSESIVAELVQDVAEQYLNYVADRLKDYPHIHREFIDILTRYRSGEIDTRRVIEKVNVLFCFDGPLMAGFCVLLPFQNDSTGGDFADPMEESHTETSPSLPRDTFSTSVGEAFDSSSASTGSGTVARHSRSRQYVETVKERFGKYSEEYRRFLSMLYEYQTKNRGNFRALIDGVATLFDGHQDLLEEFIPFLPVMAQETARSQFRLDAKTETAVNAESHKDPVGLCIVCMDEEKSHSFVPCGHFCVCQVCAFRCIIRYGSCPICRREASTAVKTCFTEIEPG